MSIREKIVKKTTEIIYNRAGTIMLTVLLLTVISVYLTLKLTINYDQLGMIPENLASVKATREVIQKVGGIGNLIIALKGNDVRHMKNVADDLTLKLKELPDIRTVACKEEVEFIQKHVAYLIKTEDLEEAYTLLKKKIRLATRAALGKPDKESDDEVNAEFVKLFEKYRRINNKEIDDPYYLDNSRQMLLIMLRANGNPNDLDYTRKLLGDVQSIIDNYNKNNKRKAVLKEKYKSLADDATITYGITGDYKRNLEDADVIQKALAPTAVVSFVGILLYLLITMRRVSQIAILLSILTASVIMTYAFAKLALGELNTITSILGAVLMGFGIDFGIHFIYRFREEYSHLKDLKLSIEHTLFNSGYASLVSSSTTAISLFVLLFADFKGFSHFGLMAGAGIIITYLMMYICIPSIYVLICRVRPDFKKNLIVKLEKIHRGVLAEKVYPFARPVLIVSAILTVVLTFFAFRVSFEYDSRKYMTGETPSVVLQEEIAKRYKFDGDPVIIYTETIEEAKAVYDKLSSVPDTSAIGQVLSIYTVVPDMEKQKANREILDRVQKRMKDFPEDAFKGPDKEVYKVVKGMLGAKTFTMDDVPLKIKSQFWADPKTPDKGYMTFVYPRGNVWDGKQIVEFTNEIGTFEAGGKIYHAGGMHVLWGDLAKIVLRDGRIFPLIAAGIILIVILIGYRDPKAIFFAMLPLVLGMGWLLGIMAVTNWKINFVNIVAFPVILGYGISNGIQLYNRYLENRSIMVAIRITGMAVIGSAVTTLIGWAALLVSNHNALISMGVISIYGISATLIIAFTFMPALIQVAGEVFPAMKVKKSYSMEMTHIDDSDCKTAGVKSSAKKKIKSKSVNKKSGKK